MSDPNLDVRQLVINTPFSIQLVFSNFYLGIALGALDYASKYTATNTRAWPFGGDVSRLEGIQA